MPATTPLVQAPLERLRYLRELQKRAAKIKAGVARYYDDPVGFAHDCINWGDGDGLTFYQEEILGALPELKREAVRGPHGLGKSSEAAIAVLWFALTRDAAGVDWKVVTTAGSWHQLCSYTWPEIHKWAGKLRWDKVRDGRPFSRAHELQNINLKLAHGAAFAAASANAALIEGAHADSLMFVYDEAKAIPAPTFDACEGAFSGAGEGGTEAFALALSTPGQPQGRFYDICKRKAGYEDWHPVHVTLEDAMAAGRVTGEWAEQRARQWGIESAIYQNRVLGEFYASDEDSVIPLAWAEAAVARWHAWDDAGRPDTGKDFLPRTVGVDVARTGSDKTVFALRCGPVITELRRSAREDTMATTGRTKAILDADPSCTAVVDVIGIGAGVVDRLRELGARVLAFNASKGTTLIDSTREFHFTNCLTGDARVTPVGDLLRIYRSRYDGPLFRVKTAGGDEFTATPNHNVLTLRGWVAVKALRVGDKLCDASGGKQPPPAAQPEVRNMPPMLSEIYRAAQSRLEPERMHAGSVNFHGDRPVGEVEVVTINGDLLAVNPAGRQERPDLKLGGLLHRKTHLTAQCRPAQPRMVDGELGARGGDDRGVVNAQALERPRPPVSISEPAGHEPIGVGVVPDGNASFGEDAAHAAPGGLECAHNIVDRLACHVPGSDGVLIDVRDGKSEGFRLAPQRDLVLTQDPSHDVLVNAEAPAEAGHGLAGEIPARHGCLVNALGVGQGGRLGAPAWLDAVFGEDPVADAPVSPEELAERCHRLASQIPLDEITGIELTFAALHSDDPFVYTLETSTGAYRTSSVVQRNCRSAAWWTLRTALDPSGDPDICLPDDEMLLGDLSAPHWAVTSSGKIQVESKDDIRKRLGRSTDDGDAVVQAYVPHLADHVANARPWAGAIDLAAIGQTEDAAMRRRRQVPGSPQTPPDAPWDLDGWAPADDDQQHPENGRRGNVRSWR